MMRLEKLGNCFGCISSICRSMPQLLFVLVLAGVLLAVCGCSPSQPPSQSSAEEAAPASDSADEAVPKSGSDGDDASESGSNDDGLIPYAETDPMNSNNTSDQSDYSETGAAGSELGGKAASSLKAAGYEVNVPERFYGCEVEYDESWYAQEGGFGLGYLTSVSRGGRTLFSISCSTTNWGPQGSLSSMKLGETNVGGMVVAVWVSAPQGTPAEFLEEYASWVIVG